MHLLRSTQLERTDLGLVHLLEIKFVRFFRDRWAVAGAQSRSIRQYIIIKFNLIDLSLVEQKVLRHILVGLTGALPIVLVVVMFYPIGIFDELVVLYNLLLDRLVHLCLSAVLLEAAYGRFEDDLPPLRNVRRVYQTLRLLGLCLGVAGTHSHNSSLLTFSDIVHHEHRVVIHLEVIRFGVVNLLLRG